MIFCFFFFLMILIAFLFYGWNISWYFGFFSVFKFPNRFLRPSLRVITLLRSSLVYLGDDTDILSEGTDIRLRSPTEFTFVNGGRVVVGNGAVIMFQDHPFRANYGCDITDHIYGN